MSVKHSGKGRLLYQEPLAPYTSWRVGGPAARLYKPQDLGDLQLFLQQLPASESILWLGLGSNSLVRDRGFDGTVILTQGCLNEMALLEARAIKVGAGVSCASMARFAARNQLCGGEFWAGIPGTMGGALRMNAGCHGKETWQWVRSVETIDREGKLRVRYPQEFEVSYRHVAGLEQQEWFVSATFELESGDKEQSLAEIKELLDYRARTQPINEYNCGSVFRNPTGNFAAKLIESCGLKGARVGGAMVSQKHANFIINDQGMACSQDIETLISLIQAQVSARTAIDLVCEVHIIGEAHV